MAVSRAEIVDSKFRSFIEEWSGDHPTEIKTEKASAPGSHLSPKVAEELFESQALSRHIDLEARRLRAQNLGFYTIGSAGHEGNVVLGRTLEVTDPCLLHYRSGALMIERARKGGEKNFVYSTLLGACAAVSDPVAGGRHKVWGSRRLWVPPQTSTIASHLPKAVGMAWAIERGNKIGLSLPVPNDAIVCCTFGDATINHSVALAAFNSAEWSAYQRIPLPILFVCEDNDIGISVKTPPGWVKHRFQNHPHMKYFYADGLNLFASFEVAIQAIKYCRTKRTPVFLHLKTIRLLGHAGSDVETEYLAKEEIEAQEAKDPLLTTAALLLEKNVLSKKRLLEIYEAARKIVQNASTRARKERKLTTAEEIMTPLAPYHSSKVDHEARRADYARARGKIFGEKLPENEKPKHLAALLNAGLADLLVKYPEAIIFGEDVAKKGGVYHVTTRLAEQFGVSRVFNTLLDETTILGLGIGAAHLGFLPIPEIQYLAYYHNAEDQIRGEAGSLQFFSNGAFRNPLVVRIASFAYQKGFGGHFHNDNSIAALRDVPGIIIAVPSRGDDAVEMLRTALALAKIDGRVVLFLEPIALYMTKDLYEPGDGRWQFSFPHPGKSIGLGEPRIYHPEAKDLSIITFGNGLYLSLRAARTLATRYRIHVRVMDLRWLVPLNEEKIIAEAKITSRVLVVDECRRAGGISEAVLALLAEQKNVGVALKSARLTAQDTYLPLGPAAEIVLPSEEEIVKASRELMQGKGVGRK